MIRYIAKRLAAGLLTIVVLITLAFALMHAMPGGPFSPAEEKKVLPEVLEQVAAKYGLDRPEFYADLAKAFLMDKDAGGAEAKMAGYYHGVVKRNA